MIKEAIKKLVAGNDLTFDEAAQVMDGNVLRHSNAVADGGISHSLENQG